MKTVVITGANRGIGLAFAQAYRQRGDRVIAACRRPEAAEELQALDCRIEQFDAADPESALGLAGRLTADGERIDHLVNNAGCGASESDGLSGLDWSAMSMVYQVNVLAPLQLTRALLPLLQPDAVVGCLVSRLGVIRPPQDAGGGAYSYGMTKAALIRSLPILAADLGKRGIHLLGLDPGFVETDMTAGAGGPRWKLSPEESATGMIAVLDAARQQCSGSCLRWNGEQCKWYAPKESAEEQQLLPA